MPQGIQQEIEAILEKIDRNMTLYGTKFPNKEAEGRYSLRLNDDGSWTGSFWTGMLFLAYKHTKNQKYLERLYDYVPVYQQRLHSGYKDHDLGFLFQLYSAVLYQETSDEVFRDLTVGAADELMKRYNPRGKFLRAWGQLDDGYRAGKMIVDCMMNLPLLFSASAITGDHRYAEVAQNHADTTANHNVRQDHSTYHTFDFDPDTGAPLGGFNEGGYDDESCWSRGQAWTIYGFVLMHRQTQDQRYFTLAEGLTRYFMRNLNPDSIPAWDFRLPNADTMVDTSAAAIAAAGLLDLSPIHRSHGMTILNALRTRYSRASDPRIEGILPSCFAREEGINRQMYTIWGDYFYLECLLKASGSEVSPWVFHKVPAQPTVSAHHDW